jgi:hypothetical protein
MELQQRQNSLELQKKLSEFKSHKLKIVQETEKIKITFRTANKPSVKAAYKAASKNY